MKARSVLFAAFATALVAAASGCSGSSSTQAGTASTTVAASQGTTVPAQGNQSALPPAQAPGGQGGNPSAGDANSPQPAPATSAATDTPQPTIAPVTTNPAPNGSGHGLCFDLNSGLANSAIKSLAPTTNGGWGNPSASNDPISAGCDGVLSWMTVESGNIHPYTHVLFFTNGTYLGTATSSPYGYTEVIGKTANTVSVQYKWAKSSDALCCPSGGPSVVTFTLSGGKVVAKGQFPPSN
ncbi:LppP/LprE family lipoprotein [Nocardia sp. NPDC004860]|uniref:LppP/LprE family lipoprotein n=1 Tax=Nocardia sp. NPDC004860 TaxID=3154557 RepID=UPI0033B1BECA